LNEAPRDVAGVYSARFTIDRSTGRTSINRFDRQAFAPYRRNVITTSSVLVHRRCFDTVGLFDEELEAGSDWDMWVRIALRFQFKYIDEPLVRYTVHGNSISGNMQMLIRSRERLLEKHANVFAKHPRFLSGWYALLGSRYSRLGDSLNARRSFVKALRAWPLSFRAWCGLAALIRHECLHSVQQRIFRCCCPKSGEQRSGMP
jgi:hypothetical protein